MLYGAVFVVVAAWIMLTLLHRRRADAEETERYRRLRFELEKIIRAGETHRTGRKHEAF